MRVTIGDHPATPDRIDHVNAFIAQKGLGGSNTNLAGFAPIKQRVGSRVSPASTLAPPGGAPPNHFTPPPN